MANNQSNPLVSDDDELLYEFPAYLSKCDTGDIYVLQYPSFNLSSAQLDGPITSARMKVNCQQLELYQSVQDGEPIYDQGKGSHLATNVDGIDKDVKDSKDKYFESGVMDKVVMRSECPLKEVDRYAVGYNKAGHAGLYLTPVHSVLLLRPSLDYIDKSEERQHRDDKKKGQDNVDDGELSDSGESSSRAVTVRFERPETDRSRNARINSYGHLQRKIQEEAWVNIEYYGLGHPYSEKMKELALENASDDLQTEQFQLTSRNYLSSLVPPFSDSSVAAVKNTLCPSAASEATGPSIEETLVDVPQTLLGSFHLEKQLEIIMRKVGVGNYEDILDCLEDSAKWNEQELILKLQICSTLVQGCWVLKSDLLYHAPDTTESTPTASTSKYSGPASTKSNKQPVEQHTAAGTPYSEMQNAREYALCLLAKEGYLNRTDMLDVADLPGEDILDILKGIAKPVLAPDGKGTGRWDFLLPRDNKFIAKHKDVFQRYSMKWENSYIKRKNYTKQKQSKR